MTSSGSQQRHELAARATVHAAIAVEFVRGRTASRSGAVVKRRPQRRVRKAAVVLVVVAAHEADGREGHRAALFELDACRRPPTARRRSSRTTCRRFPSARRRRRPRGRPPPGRPRRSARRGSNDDQTAHARGLRCRPAMSRWQPVERTRATESMRACASVSPAPTLIDSPPASLTTAKPFSSVRSSPTNTGRAARERRLAQERAHRAALVDVLRLDFVDHLARLQHVGVGVFARPAARSPRAPPARDPAHCDSAARAPRP